MLPQTTYIHIREKVLKCLMINRENKLCQVETRTKYYNKNKCNGKKIFLIQNRFGLNINA